MPLFVGAAVADLNVATLARSALVRESRHTLKLLENAQDHYCAKNRIVVCDTSCSKTRDEELNALFVEVGCCFGLLLVPCHKTFHSMQQHGLDTC